MKLKNILTILTLAATAAIDMAAQSVLSVRDTITDPSFVYPESFEADTHKLMQNWYMQNYTVLDKPSPATGTPATERDYIDRLMTMPAVIEMPYNSLVKASIEMYTQRRRSLVERMLGMSTYYMPIFEQALEKEGVPMELKYLPIIESALNPNAVSRAGATGLWQLMLPTARGLGLEINSIVDERRDPFRSSEAAARYLRQLHDIYNDWSLAIAAYNCGPGNVNKALRRAGEGKKDFWEIYPYLPRETRGYLPGFIAANYAMNYYDRHDISPALAKRPLIVDSVHVSKRVHFQQIADVLNIPIEEIRILNPQYRIDVIPGDIRPYPLVLPSHQVLSYIISEDSIINHNALLYARRDVVEPSDGATRISDDGNYIITEVVKYHKVRRGETFAKIARKYGVTVASIKRTNGIRTLKAGRTIKIVTTKRTPRPKEEPAAGPTTAPVDSVTVVDVTEEVVPATFDENEPAAASPAENDATVQIDPQPSENDPLDDEPAETETGSEEEADDASDTPSETEEASDSSSEIETIVTETENTTAQPAQPAAEAARQPADSVKPSEANNRVRDTFNKPVRDNKPAAPKPVYHKVRRGENLSKIARRYGTTVRKIENLNPGMNPSRINAGQRIRVK